MMSFYKKMVTLLALLLPTLAAAQADFPKGCEGNGFVFYQNYLVLNEHGKQMFFLIYNHGNDAIEFEHYETKADAFMSPKLESKLSPTHWSAFASDVPELYFQCFTRKGEAEHVAVNCQDYLDVCQYPRVKFALSNQGNYWVSTDKVKQKVISDAIAKGIFLHW